METSKLENWNQLIYRKVLFLSDPHCQFPGVDQGVKHICTYGYILCSYSHRFIRTMQTAYRGSSRKTIRSHPILQFHITLYRWYPFTPSIKEILIETTSSGIWNQLRDIYFICWFCWNVATYKWKLQNWNIEISSFIVKFPQEKR
jgi:hypothetical protein